MGTAPDEHPITVFTAAPVAPFVLLLRRDREAQAAHLALDGGYLDEHDDGALLVVGRTAMEGQARAGGIAAKLSRRSWTYARVGEA